MNLSLPHMRHGFAPPDAINFGTLVVRGALHEIFAPQNVGAAAACFALGVLKPGRLFWLRQELVRVESGTLYPPGLATLGFDPSHVISLTLRDAQSVLQAGLEVARSQGSSAAIMELWGAAKIYTLTASRKLALAAKATGTTLFVINHAAEPSPSAAETRWQVRCLPSQILAGHAPGLPAFEVTLLRHRRSARSGQVWCVEWNNEKRCFETRRKSALINASPLFKPVASLPAFRKVPLYKVA